MEQVNEVLNQMSAFIWTMVIFGFVAFAVVVIVYNNLKK